MSPLLDSFLETVMNLFFASLVTINRLLRRFAILCAAVLFCGTNLLLHSDSPPPLPTLRLTLPPDSSVFTLRWEDPSASGSSSGTNFVLETTPMTSLPAYWTPLQPVSQPLVASAASNSAAFFRLRWSSYWRSQMDSDGDGINDGVEEQNPQFLAPDRASDAVEDWDRDGVSNRDEVLAGTDPDDFSGQLAAVDGTGWGIKKAGGLWGWGANPGGRLGDGTVEPVINPRPIAGGHPWRFIAGGLWHSLAIDQEGHLWGWGTNASSELGDGTTIRQPIPVKVGPSIWSAVAVGHTFDGGFSVGIQRDGTLWQWGAPIHALSGGIRTNIPALPARLGSESDWIALSAGAEHVVGLRSDGTLWEWGLNYLGAFGRDVPFDAEFDLPIQVGSDAHWRHIAAGMNVTLAIKQDGTLWGWGNLPLIIAADQPSLPVEVGRGWRWRSAAAVDQTILAIRDDGTLWAWGLLPRASGQTEPSVAPVAIFPGTRWHALVTEAGATATPGTRVLARRDDGTLWMLSTRNDAWGLHERPWPLPTTHDWKSVSARDGWSLGLCRDGSLWTWGTAPYFSINLPASSAQSLIRPVEPGSRWRAAGAGSVRGLGLQTDGSLWLWGETFRYFGGAWVGGGTIGGGNEHGNGGTPTWVPAQSPTPSWVPSLFGPVATWTKIDQGNDHGVGIQSDGTLWHWGLFPRPGTDTAASRAQANQISQVGVGTAWTQVRAGANHNLALDSEGGLWAWGYNDAGQVGDGSTHSHSVPTPIGDSRGWVDLAAGDHHSLAVASDGTLWVWGSNAQQQLGLPGVNQSLVPVQLSASHGWRRVFAGGDSSFALSDDGRLWAWGANDQGQLGLGDRLSHPLPTTLAMSRGWQSLSVDRQHTLAVREDGSLWGWGANFAGQLADDSVTLNVTQIDSKSDW